MNCHHGLLPRGGNRPRCKDLCSTSCNTRGKRKKKVALSISCMLWFHQLSDAVHSASATPTIGCVSWDSMGVCQAPNLQPIAPSPKKGKQSWRHTQVAPKTVKRITIPRARPRCRRKCALLLTPAAVKDKPWNRCSNRQSCGAHPLNRVHDEDIILPANLDHLARDVTASLPRVLPGLPLNFATLAVSLGHRSGENSIGWNSSTHVLDEILESRHIDDDEVPVIIDPVFRAPLDLRHHLAKICA